MSICSKPALVGLAAALSLCTGGCIGGMASNRSLESLNQPVVERASYALEVSTGYDGLDVAEQRRLAGWFDVLGLRYGDTIAIDDPTGDSGTRAAVQQVAGRYGLLVSDQAPLTAGALSPGTARVVVSRTVATVPNCPNWSGKSDANFNNATSPGYGCAVNGNLAAMVANPEHLLRGERGTGETTVLTSNKAIDSYREQAPTGEQGLKQTSSAGGK